MGNSSQRHRPPAPATPVSATVIIAVVVAVVVVIAVVVVVAVVVVITVVIAVVVTVVVVAMIITTTIMFSRLRVRRVRGGRFVGIHRRLVRVGQALIERLVPLVILVALWFGFVVLGRMARNAASFILFPVPTTRRAGTPMGRRRR